MKMRRPVRATVALAAAYAVVLQATLLAFGVSIAGTAGFAGVPICSNHAAGFGGDPSAPAGRGQDCLDACLTGCCGNTPVCPAPGPAIAYAPALLQTVAVAQETAPVVRQSLTFAHRPRAPPFA